MQAFSSSAYLRTLRRPDGWAVYHSLFGNLTILDGASKQFLESFARPATLDEAVARFPSPAKGSLRSLANQLVIRSFLMSASANEFCLVEESARVRRERLHTGYLLRGLQLVLANACNFSCKYCFLKMQQGDRTAAPDGGPDRMEPALAELALRRALEVVRRNGGQQLTVEFFGGEPLLNWPALEHVLETFGDGEGTGVRIVYSITSNGSLVTREIAELLARHRVTVTVSVDVPSRAGCLPMAAKDGERIRAHLELLRLAGNAVTFNSVLSQETLAQVDPRALVEFAARCGARAIGLILDLDPAFYRSDRNRDLAREKILAAVGHGREAGVRVGGYWHQTFAQIAGTQPINLHSGYKTCPATGCKLSVEPGGEVFTCKCTSHALGHVSRLDEVFASDRYRRYAMRAYRHAAECAGCAIEGFCSGVCMGSLENGSEGEAGVVPGACDLFRSLTRELILDWPASEARHLELDGAGG